MGKANGAAWIHYLGLLTPLLAPVAVGVIPGMALAGVVGGFLALCGSVSTQRVMEDLARRDRTEPPRGKDLHNHHMALVAGHALLLALGKPRKGGLARLGGELVPVLFRQLEALDKSNVASPALQSLERLAMDLMQGAGAPPEVDQARTRAWAGIADALHAEAQVSDPTIIKMTDAQRDTLIEEIDAVVPHFIYELLKEDAAGAGPAQGRAFPAFLMKRLEAVHDSVASASIDIQATVLDESHRVLRRIMEAFATSAAEVRGIRGELGAFAGQVTKDLASLKAHGLLSVRQYSNYVWEQALFGLDELTGARALRSLVGREAERTLFRDFLANGSARVLHWRAYPGVGKTRLALDHAEKAERSGWSVRFVSNTVQDLVQAVQQTWDGTTPLCLIWDNYDGTKPEQLKAFLRVHDSLGPLMENRIFGVLLAWPAHAAAEMADFRLSEAYVTRDLGGVPSEAHSEASRWVAQLAPSLAESVREAVLKGASGAPRSILVRLNAAVSGTQVDALNVPGEVEREHYDSIYLRLLLPSAEGAMQRLRVLRGLALLGTIPYDAAKLRLALDMLELTQSEVDRASYDLLLTRCIGQDEIGLHLSSDDLRTHILRYGHSLPREPDDPIERLGPWLPTALRLSPQSTWGIVRYSSYTVGTSLVANKGSPSEALDSLLCAVDELVTSATPETARSRASVICNATEAEPDPKACLGIAGRIARLRATYDTPEIAEQEATALVSATFNEPDRKACLGIADRIASLRETHDTPEIAEQEANALLNATAAEPDPEAHLRRAGRIASLRATPDTRKSAGKKARALCPPTSLELNREACLGIADRIASLRATHNTPEIARDEARALFNATILWLDPKACLGIADRIAGLRATHDTPEIAQAEARVLFNAVIAEPVPKARTRGVNRLRRLAKDHDTSEIRTIIEMIDS